MEVGLVLAAAGLGERLGKQRDKALVPLLGRPLLAWSLLAFEGFLEIVERVVVVPPGSEGLYRENVIAPLRLRTPVTLVAGGKFRQESVANGLAALGPAPRWVLVHDAARPLVGTGLIRRVLDAMDGGESIVPALPLRDSLARIGYETWLKGYVDRTDLLAVQTPQGFHRPVLEYAQQKAKADAFSGTDEASIVLRVNHAVSWIEGDVENFKITYPQDLVLAEAVLRARGFRGGNGS